MTPHPQVPHDYPRRVLLAVAGLSPQIVTETLFALAVRGEPRFVPTEVHLITTTEGAERAELSLLSEDPGWFRRLLDDYGLPPIAFRSSHIHVVTDDAGQPLADIRTAADNARVADQIAERVRALTADADSALHVSIAGGRKTMGYYAGYALSLFGRPQDRLSHVLVSEPYEQSWQFFYPSPASRVIETRDHKLVDTKDARVTLAEIPFVRLRHGLPQPLLDGHAGFFQTIAAAQRAQEPPALIIDLHSRRIQAGGQVVEMTPASLAFYAVFARRTLAGQEAACQFTDGFKEQYLAALGDIAGPDSGTVEKAEIDFRAGMSAEQFQSRKSRIKRLLHSALGPQVAAPYLIDDNDGDEDAGAYPYTRYRLNLPAAAVRFDSVAGEGERLQVRPGHKDA